MRRAIAVQGMEKKKRTHAIYFFNFSTFQLLNYSIWKVT